MKKTTLLLLLTVWHLAYSGSNQEIQFLFPIPKSTMLAKETVIIIRFNQVMPDEISNLKSFISIRGSKSGDMEGNTIICTDQKTINFKPISSFLPNERVKVSLNPKLAGTEQTFIDSTFYFDVSPFAEIPANVKVGLSGRSSPVLEKNVTPKLRMVEDPQIINGISVPSNFPEFEITINDNPDTGLIFMTNIGYALILNNMGYPLWYWGSEGHPLNLKVQHGLMTVNTEDWDPSFALDSTYTIVREFISPPGYWFNDHELKLLPNGNYLIIVNDQQQMDLTHLGGQPDAWVTGNHVAEMDAEDNLVFFWRSWDRFDVADAVHEDLTKNYINHIHMNSLDVDSDGHIVISCRNQSEITKINRQTGDIIWRLGGENDYFTWVNDAYRNSYQHDVRVLPDGNITLFDNGRHRSPEFSRALELSVDTTTWEATKVWEFREDPDIFSQWMGSVQRLPNGDTGISWEAEYRPRFTEVRPDKSKAFELDFKYGDWVYRVQRFSWNGIAAVPYLVVESYEDRMTLIFNKFGDPDVQEYKIYGGLNPSSTKLLATTSEPFIHLTELLNHQNYYFRVTAVNSAGQEGGFSNEVWAYVKFVYPGSNLVVNGNFARYMYYWNEKVNDDNAAADIRVTEREELWIEIYTPGTARSDIQVYNDRIPLEQGKEYLFEFDAYSFGNRKIEAEVMHDGINLSQMGLSRLTPNKTQFSHRFIYENESITRARVVLNAGGASGHVWIDNVSLKEIITSIEPGDDVPLSFNLEQNYPNPFNPITAIGYRLPAVSDVDLSIYTLLGEKVASLVSEKQNPGYHQVEWDAGRFSSGVYYYRIEAGEFVEVKKMVLLR